MTDILCKRRDCQWCDAADGACTRYSVEISEDGCEDYDTIFNLPEYQETFWIAVGGGDKPMYRVEKTGKEIEYQGRVFYTTEQVDERESFLVTDGITGALCGTFARVKAGFVKFLVKAAEYPDVMSYPEAQIIGGKCIPVVGAPEEEKPPVVSTAEFTGILDELRRMYGGGDGADRTD